MASVTEASSYHNIAENAALIAADIESQNVRLANEVGSEAATIIEDLIIGHIAALRFLRLFGKWPEEWLGVHD